MVPAGDKAANVETVPGKLGHLVSYIEMISLGIQTSDLSIILKRAPLAAVTSLNWTSFTKKLQHSHINKCTLTTYSLVMFPFLLLPVGEEALTMYLAKNKLDRKLANATQNVEALHQLASSYFIDRDGTMRKLHEIQISTNAIKVSALYMSNRQVQTCILLSHLCNDSDHIFCPFIV